MLFTFFRVLDELPGRREVGGTVAWVLLYGSGLTILYAMPEDEDKKAVVDRVLFKVYLFVP